MNLLAITRSARIEKRGYSRNPWRAVVSEGEHTGLELTRYVDFDHPTLGRTVSISEPIMGRTKRDCVAALAARVEQLERDEEQERASIEREAARGCFR